MKTLSYFFLFFLILILGKNTLAQSRDGEITENFLPSETTIEPINYGEQETLSLCEIPIELALLNDFNTIPDHIITAQTISQETLAVPSLWWAKQQFDRHKGKLIRNWLAYTEAQRIDLVVNRQIWSLMNYLDRYRLLHEFGSVARAYGYNLRVVNQFSECLATYHFTQENNLSQWQIIFYFQGENSLQL